MNGMMDIPTTGGGLSSLFQNRLFLSLLSGAGAGLAQNPAVSNINQITQQSIASQSYMKLLQRMLGGEVPRDGKLTIDEKGMKLDVPKSALEGPMSMTPLEGAQQGSQLPGGSGIDWSKQKAINPFATSQPGISAADLAGLTTQDITQALQSAMGVEDLKRQSIEDVYNRMYKFGFLDIQRGQAETARLAEWRRIKEIPEKVDVDVGGGKIISVDPKDALSYYAKVNDLPASFETYKIARGDPEFKRYLVEMAGAGATKINIGDIRARAETLADVKARKYLTDPRGFARDMRKYMGSEAVLGPTFNLGEDERPRALARLAEKEAVRLIKSTGGKIVSSRVEGRTFIWTVKWPDGTTSEVSYAN